jgi:hypothetical protein
MHPFGPDKQTIGGTIMNQKNHFTQATRVANFTPLELTIDNRLDVGSEAPSAIVEKIRRHADLPYVFVVARERAQQAVEVLKALEAIRSPCTPYALFTLFDEPLGVDGSDVDILTIDAAAIDSLQRRIDAYIGRRFVFDSDRLRIGGQASPPRTVDVVIIGGGVIGLYAAERLRQEGISFCVFEKRDRIGGIWSAYANTTSRVNTSEGAYRLIEPSRRSNRDHSPTREILEDMVALAGPLADRIFLNTEIGRIDKADRRYRISYEKDGQKSIVNSKGVILAINDRVGEPKAITWENQAAFQGEIVVGISDKALHLDWRHKQVVIVGMGAFAIENARTALEGGASHVTVVCRRHGTVCPKIIDYLNFATPYDDAFKHDKKSNFRNMMYWKKIYEMSGATQPECWMGKVKHAGHTISVSDIWFVGHYLKKIETVRGTISSLYENGAIVDGQRRIDADIIVNCIGFERNTSMAKNLSGYDQTTNINYIDRDFMYLADAYIDDDAFNSFFGSSVLEMAKFYLEVYISGFDNPRYDEFVNTEGVIMVPLEDRRWSHYIAGAMSLIDRHPDLHAFARQQISHRTDNFLEKHDLETYIRENKREWIDLHTLLNGKPMAESDCLSYQFDKLLPQ